MENKGTTSIKGVEFDVTYNGRVYCLDNPAIRIAGMGRTIEEAKQDVLSEAKQIKQLFYDTIEKPELKSFLDKI
jgi:hypothetical protein